MTDEIGDLLALFIEKCRRWKITVIVVLAILALIFAVHMTLRREAQQCEDKGGTPITTNGTVVCFKSGVEVEKVAAFLG